jgi:hypothetical protein
VPKLLDPSEKSAGHPRWHRLDALDATLDDGAEMPRSESLGEELEPMLDGAALPGLGKAGLHQKRDWRIFRASGEFLQCFEKLHHLAGHGVGVVREGEHDALGPAKLLFGRGLAARQG